MNSEPGGRVFFSPDRVRTAFCSQIGHFYWHLFCFDQFQHHYLFPCHWKRHDAHSNPGWFYEVSVKKTQISATKNISSLIWWWQYFCYQFLRRSVVLTPFRHFESGPEMTLGTKFVWSYVLQFSSFFFLSLHRCLLCYGLLINNHHLLLFNFSLLLNNTELINETFKKWNIRVPTTGTAEAFKGSREEFSAVIAAMLVLSAGIGVAGLMGIIITYRKKKR